LIQFHALTAKIQGHNQELQASPKWSSLEDASSDSTATDNAPQNLSFGFSIRYANPEKSATSYLHFSKPSIEKSFFTTNTNDTKN
jgi:hypothetical protein